MRSRSAQLLMTVAYVLLVPLFLSTLLWAAVNLLVWVADQSIWVIIPLYLFAFLPVSWLLGILGGRVTEKCLESVQVTSLRGFAIGLLKVEAFLSLIGFASWYWLKLQPLTTLKTVQLIFAILCIANFLNRIVGWTKYDDAD